MERRVSEIHGWVRRFYQGSVDHRGVPGAAGRVVTLLPEPGGTCGGVAFRLPSEQTEAILARLDVRERGGYQQLRLPLHEPGGAPFAEGLTYVAGEENRNYLGPAPVDAIAAQVRAARGPSGPNREYVERLATALQELAIDDPHVFAVAEALAENDPGETP